MGRLRLADLLNSTRGRGRRRRPVCSSTSPRIACPPRPVPAIPRDARRTVGSRRGGDRRIPQSLACTGSRMRARGHVMISDNAPCFYNSVTIHDLTPVRVDCLLQSFALFRPIQRQPKYSKEDERRFRKAAPDSRGDRCGRLVGATDCRQTSSREFPCHCSAMSPARRPPAVLASGLRR